jgi:hypothetical protein
VAGQKAQFRLFGDGLHDLHNPPPSYRGTSQYINFRRTVYKSKCISCTDWEEAVRKARAHIPRAQPYERRPVLVAT